MQMTVSARGYQCRLVDPWALDSMHWQAIWKYNMRAYFASTYGEYIYLLYLLSRTSTEHSMVAWDCPYHAIWPQS